MGDGHGLGEVGGARVCRVVIRENEMMIIYIGGER